MTLEKARYVKMPYLCGFQQFICGQRVTNQKVIIILNLIQYNVKAPRINSKGLCHYTFLIYFAETNPKYLPAILI